YENGIRPEQYNNFVELEETATREELIMLTNHSNGVVRCYSFWALSHDSTAELFPVILNHLNDTGFVSTLFGCIGGDEMVGDFFINIVTPGYVDLQSHKLNPIQFAVLDSILIYTPNNLWAKSNAILRAKPSERDYLKLRELVIKEHNQDALVKLAQYRKEQDVELILNNREKSKTDEGGYFYTYKAIIEFPHPDFFPLLEKNLYQTLDNTHYSNEWRGLYSAIAGYKNQRALSLLKVPLTQVKHNNISEYHIDYVFGAVRYQKDTLYDDLLWTLWEKENKITPDVFEYLNARDTNRAFKLAKEYIKDPYKYYSWDSDMDECKELLNALLGLVLLKQYNVGVMAIVKNIAEANVHTFPIFADKAAIIKDSLFIEPLLDRLKTEDNPHVYLKAVAALISYNNAGINKKVLETRKKNKELTTGWGGEALDKLLKENSIE
ncbi:MAG TPA: hypothetical protein VEC12_07580, partial [Bacteroidia bacterium]|nr:hypothetical protein [Bacteroidia bacterium]